MYFENLTNITKFPNYSGFLTKKSSSIFNIFGNKVKRFFILSQNKIFYKHNMESDYIIKNFYLNSNTIIRTSDDNDNAFEIIFLWLNLTPLPRAVVPPVKSQIASSSSFRLTAGIGSASFSTLSNVLYSDEKLSESIALGITTMVLPKC